MRILLGIPVLLLGAWLIYALFAPDDLPVANARQFENSAGCQECHAEVYDEWQESQHAAAWTNPLVRKLSNDFSNKDCIDCHAPQSIWVTGIGERVLPRATHRKDGVDCLACHALPGGGVVGTLTNPRAACRPVEDRALARPDFCAACHNQHKTFDQWRESEWPARGKDCLDCHMPYRDGDPNKGRDHRSHGGDSLAMLQAAVDMRVVTADDAGVAPSGWVVEVENVGAGHAYPTDERSRASDVFWRPLVDAGADELPWQHLYRFRDPYRDEDGIERTILFPHDTRVIPVPESAVAGPFEVALFYKRSPYYENPEQPDPDREAVRVHTQVVTP